MAQNYSLLIESADHIVWDSGAWNRSPKLYVTLALDDNPVSKTRVFKRSLNPKWNFSSNLLCPMTSVITLRLYHSTTFPCRADPFLGECKMGIEELLRQCSSGEVVQLNVAAEGQVSEHAKERMQATVGIPSPIGSAFDKVDAAVEAGAAQNDLATALGACVDRLDVFVKMGDKIAQAHPYLSAAWTILTSVYQAVKQQQEMDKEVVDLVNTMVEVYSFKEDINFVSDKIKILEDGLTNIAQQTLKCAKFLEEYKQHGFSGRAIRTSFLNSNRKRIDDLSEELVKLKESFTHALSTQTLFHTNEIRKKLDQSGVLEKLKHISYDASLRSECLPGTREDILDDISKWLTTPSGPSNVLWLSGVAGSGKSSIATSLSQRFRDQDCLGAFIFFTRNTLANSNPTAVLHSIAYSLAQFNDRIRDALCEVIAQKPGIVDAPIRSQFEALMRGPLVSAQPYLEKPIVIILDALDECSDNNWRATLISLIADDFSTLPLVFRFLITSRPDADITGRFRAQRGITAQTLSVSAAETGEDVAFDAVQSVAFSPDGRRIVSGSYDNTIRIWDSETGAALGAPLTGHSGRVLSVAFSPDGRRIVSGSDDNTIRIWDSETGAALGAPLTGHSGTVLSVAFSPDGRRIVSGSSDNTIRIWDSETGAALGAPLTGHSGTVLSVAFSPDGRRIVSGSYDNTIRIWDSETGAALGAPLTGHSNTVVSVAFSPDGRRIVSGSSDNTICIWDSETGAALGAPLTGHSGMVLSVAFSPDGRRIVSGSDDNTIRIWDSETGAALGAPLTGHSDTVRSVAFSPDGRRIVSGSSDNTIRIWDSETGAALGAPLTGHSSTVWSVAFSPDGRQIVSGSSDNTIRIWDSETGAALGAPLTGHSGTVWSVAFSPDGRQIVSGSYDNTIRIWDSETGAALGAPLTGHSGTVWSVAFSPDGRQIVSGSDDNTIRIWDSETGAALGAPLTGHSGTVWSVAFSPDGRRIVSGSYDNTIRIWDSETGAALGAPLTGHSGTVRTVAFSPDGRRIFSGSDDHTIRIWDSETGAALGAPLTGLSCTVLSVAFSPDGRRIVSGSDDHTIRIWDSETGAALGAPLTGHSGMVLSVAFSPDGRRIVSGSNDNTIRIWDSETGAALGAPLTGHSGMVWSVAFCPDRRRIVSGSGGIPSSLSQHSEHHSSLPSSSVPEDISCTQENIVETSLMTTTSSMFEDGWVVDSLSHRLIWVPAWLRSYFCDPRNSLIIAPQGAATLNLTHFVHGTDWKKCIDPLV
ncbi:quinon protein alcohol dehydrogenase-like superfamily [Mycena capillaripes]|nr:quinon protein alcohol dehydrogenase-like superfamily [Mycena capillaripes]